jgi:type II secretory pathway component PulJ
MRKGSSLVELLVILAILALVSVPVAILTKTTFGDIPRAYRMSQVNSSLLSAIRQMHKDINNARRLPTSFDKYTSNENMLLIELRDGVVCYELKDNMILRHNLERPEDTIKWPIHNCKVNWRVRQKGGIGYAVEIETYIEQKSGKRMDKKMANSHLYFVGAYRKP